VYITSFWGLTKNLTSVPLKSRSEALADADNRISVDTIIKKEVIL
jgi:hypothetical protein